MINSETKLYTEQKIDTKQETDLNLTVNEESA